MNTQSKFACRWAPSLGTFEKAHYEVWGTKEYDPETDLDKPAVFVGLYGLPDFLALTRHKGKKYIFWCGSDIKHLLNGYWLDTEGAIRVDPRQIGKWIAEHCESWVENEEERKHLYYALGIKAKVCPSFFGRVADFKAPEVWNNRECHAYLSSGEGRQLEYGFDTIERIAPQLPSITFHLYGADWQTEQPNVIVHGRVPKEQMNSETANMHVALSLNEFCGFSEVVAKGVLRGQYAVSRVEHPHIATFETDEELITELDNIACKEEPNLEARDYYVRHLNKFPWTL